MSIGSLRWAFIKSLISVLGLSDGCSGIPEKMRLSHRLLALIYSMDPSVVLFHCSSVAIKGGHIQAQSGANSNHSDKRQERQVYN